MSKITVDVINTNGKKIDSLTLPKEIFDRHINSQLLAQAVRIYRSNQRQATKKTKNRGEVKRTKAKVWRQKGTGRARHGSKNAPIFVGGAKAHSPTGNENYKLKLNKKMRRLALFGSLSLKAKDSAITVVSDLEKIEPRTKFALKMLTKIADYNNKSKILIITPKQIKNVWFATRNLPGVSLSQAKRLNFYEVITHEKLLITKDTLNEIKQTFLKTPGTNSPQPSSSTSPLKLSTRTINALQATGLSPEKAINYKDSELKKIKGIGSKAIAELKKAKN